MPVSNFPDGLNVGSAAGGTAEFQLGGVAVTLTAADLNALDAASLSATELGYVDGVSAGTVTASKAVVVSATKGIDVLTVALGTVTTLVAPSATFSGTANVSGVLQVGGAAVTSSAAELNFVDGSGAGTAVASKAAVLGPDKELTEVHTAALYLGSAAGTQVTATAAQLNLILPYSASGKKIVSGTMAVPAGGSGTAFVPTGLTAAEYIVHSLNGYSTNLSFADASITTGTVTMKGYCLAGTAALAAGTVSYVAIGT